MSRRRVPGPEGALGKVTALRVLLLVATLELVINRVAVPMLRPHQGAPPRWHTVLDYGGLFLFYMTGVLAALVIAQRTVEAFAAPAGARARVAQVLAAGAALLAAVPLVVSAPAALSLVLECVFATAVLAALVAAPGRAHDLGIAVGLPILASPLLLHGAAVIGAHWLWPDTTFDGPGVALARAGVTALCVAGLATPYCFAPRPFARAVTRPVPVLLAMVIAGLGAALARASYAGVVEGAKLAVGVELTATQPDPRLALYLLGIATVGWTLVSCALAPGPARRQVGAGVALIVLGGHAFRWPHHYLLPLLGLSLITSAVHAVREEELAAMPVTTTAPPVPDTAWAAYVAALTADLRGLLADVHSLTTRGEAGFVSTQIVADAGGHPVRVRIERIDGAVLALDVVIGREIDEVRPATLTLWTIAPRALGATPPGPPAAPAIRTGDAAFDERFKLRGDAEFADAVLAEDVRARAATTLDGWLACWAGEGVRYRVYPGRGAPVDHPMPLADLALGRGAAHTERFVAMMAVLVDLAGRALPPPAAGAEPALLDGGGGDEA